MKKSLLLISFLICLIALTINVVRQINDTLRSSYRIDRAAEEVVQLQQKNNQLKKQLDDMQNISFIEKQARDKLNLTRPNEKVIIVSQEDIARVLSAKTTTIQVKLSNWQGWLRLFFY